MKTINDIIPIEMFLHDLYNITNPLLLEGGVQVYFYKLGFWQISVVEAPYKLEFKEIYTLGCTREDIAKLCENV